MGLLLLFLPFGGLLQQIGFLGIGLGCAPIFPCMLHETPVRFGKKLSQSFMGIQMAFAYMGSTFMPPLFGFMTSRLSISLLPYFLVILLVFMVLSSESINLVVKKNVVLDNNC